MLRITLNDNQRKELRRISRQAIGRESERVHFVMMSDQGIRAPEIWHFTISKHKRSTDFIAFLTVVLSSYAIDAIYILVDNASIHHSAATRKWLLAHPRLQLVYLPTYTGHQLNPVEKVWWQLNTLHRRQSQFQVCG